MEGTSTSTGSSGGGSSSSSGAPFSTPAVNTDTTLSVGGSDSTPATFDELEAVMENSKKAKSYEAKESKAEAKAAAKEAVKEMKAPPKEGKDGKPQKDEPKQKASGKEDGEEETEKPVEKQADKEKPKYIKYKSGDKEAELPEDAVVTVKINGKDESVPVRELLNDYSGKTDWTRKYSEFTGERKQFQAKAKDITQKIESIFNEKDPDMRIYHMARIMDVKDPVAFRKQWIDENLKTLENYYAMSDDERKANDAAWEAKLYKHQLETDRKDREFKQAETEFNSKITKIMQTHKIDENSFAARYDELTQLYQSPKADQLIKSGKLPNEITPEFIAETIEKDRLWENAESAVSKLGLNWDPGAKTEKLMQLVEGAWREGIPASEMPSLVEAIYGDSRHEKVLEEKVAERGEFLEGKKAEGESTKRSKKEVTFFEDFNN